MTKMMKAMQFKFHDNKLKNEEQPPPTVIEVPMPTIQNDDDVLIAVKVSALDTAHEAVISKLTEAGFLHDLKHDPLLLGYHYAGTVKEVGSNVKDFKPNDEVFGFLNYAPEQKQGSFSEYIVVKQSQCSIKPSNVSFEVAAASSTESLTALQAIRDHGDLKEGKSILIVGAAGGVGSAAVQIAKSLGASNITAICSQCDVDKVRELGADVVIDRNATPEGQDVTVQLKGKTFDVIFDTPNSMYLPYDYMNNGGKYVVTNPKLLEFVWGKTISLFSSKKVEFVHVQSKREDLELVAKWLSEKNMLIDIDSEYPIKDIVNAMERQNQRKSGRVVIQVENGW